MKKSAFSVFVTLIAVVALVGVALAEATALPGSGWYSGETIQNVGSGTATIDITAYDSASSNTFNLSDSITPGSSKVYLPNAFPGMPSGFQGSAIVSSNQDIRATVNVTNRYLSSLTLGDPLTPSPAAAIYQGMNAPSTTLNFPLAKNDYFGKTTSFFIQNAGTAAATATATFKFLGVDYTFTTPPLGPGQMAVVIPADGTNGTAHPPTGNTAIGGMVATSSQPLSGSVLEAKTVEVHATILQATRAFTAADYNTTLYVPINKNNYFGRFTGIQVQNVTGGAVDVSVEYSQTAGGSCPGGTKTDSHTGIPAGQSWNFPSSVLDPGCLASAVITGSGNIVAIVSESYTAAFLAANPGRFQESTTHSAFPGNEATTVVSLPVIKEDAFNKGTGLSLQNVGGSTAHVVLTFKNATMTFVSNPQDILPSASLVLVDVRNKPASFWNGTAMTPAALGCTASGCGNNGTFSVIVTSDQPIVGLVNESTYPFSAPRILQDKNNYEGFNLVTAP